MNTVTVLDHKYKKLLKSVPGQRIITEIGTPDKIIQLREIGITNFFILGSLESIKRVFGTILSFI